MGMEGQTWSNGKVGLAGKAGAYQGRCQQWIGHQARCPATGLRSYADRIARESCEEETILTNGQSLVGQAMVDCE